MRLDRDLKDLFKRYLGEIVLEGIKTDNHKKDIIDIPSCHHHHHFDVEMVGKPCFKKDERSDEEILDDLLSPKEKQLMAYESLLGKFKGLEYDYESTRCAMLKKLYELEKYMRTYYGIRREILLSFEFSPIMILTKEKNLFVKEMVIKITHEHFKIEMVDNFYDPLHILFDCLTKTYKNQAHYKDSDKNYIVLMKTVIKIADKIIKGKLIGKEIKLYDCHNHCEHDVFDNFHCDKDMEHLKECYLLDKHDKEFHHQHEHCMIPHDEHIVDWRIDIPIHKLEIKPSTYIQFDTKR